MWKVDEEVFRLMVVLNIQTRYKLNAPGERYLKQYGNDVFKSYNIRFGICKCQIRFQD